jgi:dolichol-phosphate mannosyltransferase
MSTNDEPQRRIAVVIPCFNVEASLPAVLASFPAEIWRIYCVDDHSTDGTLNILREIGAADSRVRVVARAENGGVGAAFMEGMTAALDGGAEVIVKVDGDGQMNGAFAVDFARPILAGDADYVKGNRGCSHAERRL